MSVRAVCKEVRVNQLWEEHKMRATSLILRICRLILAAALTAGPSGPVFAEAGPLTAYIIKESAPVQPAAEKKTAQGARSRPDAVGDRS